MKNRQRFINLRPLLFTALSLIVGIVCGYFFVFFNKESSAIISIVLITCFIIFGTLLLLFAKKKIYFIVLIICLIFFILGGIRMGVYSNDFKNKQVVSGNFTVEGRIEEIVEKDNGSFYITFSKVILRTANDIVLDYKVYAYFKTNKNLTVGSYVSFPAVVFNTTVSAENMPNVNNLADKVGYYAKVIDEEKISVIRNDADIFEKTEDFLTSSLKNGSSGNEYGFLRALLLGKSDAIDGEILSGFRYAGIAHIFAVSGLHIGFLATALYFIFGLLKVGKRLRIIPIVILLFFYSGVCGFSASSLRAFIMYSVMLIMNSFGDSYDGLSSISLASLIILFYNPALLFTAGFVLSFVVAFFIIVLAPPLTKMLSFLPQKIASSLAVSIASFLSATPVSVIYFGYASVLSILLNIVLLPIISIVFMYLFIATIVGGIFSISGVLLFPVTYLVKGIIYLMNFVDFKGLAIFLGISTVGALFYYLALFAIGGMFNLKRKTKNILVIVLLSIFTMLSVNYYFEDKNGLGVKVYYSNYAVATILTEKESDVVIISKCDHINQGMAKEILRTIPDKEIDYLIIQGSTVLDMVIVDSFLSCAKLKRICKYGESKVDYYYRNLRIEHFNEERNFGNERISYKFLKAGFGVKSEFGNKKLSVFKEVPTSSVNFYLGGEDFDYAIVSNFQEEFRDKISGDVYSYFSKDGFVSAEVEGGFDFFVKRRTGNFLKG